MIPWDDFDDLLAPFYSPDVGRPAEHPVLMLKLEYLRYHHWYDGYLVDVLIDPDSELVTSINVLPASGDEAADALELIYGEEAAHGNQIEALSMDGVGFNGPLLRELEDPEKLNIDTYVPPPAER